MTTHLLVLVSLLAGGYYLTTLALWIAHRFSHVLWSPLRGFHLFGHHALYPSSNESFSERFSFGVGWHDSTYAFAPWLVLEAALIWIVLPQWAAVLVTAEAALVVWVSSHFHEQFHLMNSRFSDFPRFERARARHLLHHDHDVNFAVCDHFWDRVFWTYRPPERAQCHREESLTGKGVE